MNQFVNCFICDSKEQELMFKDINDLEYETDKGVDYIVCKKCKLISQDPLPPKSVIKTFYPPEYRNYLPIANGLFSSLKKIQFESLASKVSKHFSKDEKILEIGCGNGQLLLALQKKGFKKLYGCDFTDGSFSTLKNSGIELAACNIEESFPFKETFDVIIMNNVIEHFLNPLKVLQNCKNNLSKGGRIIFITPNSNALEFLIFRKFWAGFHAPRHTFLFNDKNVKILSKKLGFSEIKIEPITDPGQWSISIQNIFQNTNLTKTKLKNGMAWYLMPLSLISGPIAVFQNVINKSTSMMCVVRDC